ncbi:hypothetical protein ABZW11_33325 [Nonomuraea sp. NPDC004580]|uniref:hypothetical protein n=1 Tax=Nonomuraea sp. NPDC004580 TaxID=3154552 RepID=UPI0033B4B695
MRTWFEPEEAEEFEAAKAVLLRRCLAWADEHGRPADDLLIGAAIDVRHHSRDGRLAYWDEPQIRRYLLAWIPQYVVAPREILDITPDILRTYLAYLAATGLRDPRGATLSEADTAIARATPEFRKSLDDPHLQGLAKFWAQTALDHGTDLTDPDGFDDFKQDLDAGRVHYDQDILDHLTQARLLGSELDLAEERAPLQPPIALPPAPDLTTAAMGSGTVQRLTALAVWAGKDGRPLTELGTLPATDGDPDLLLAWAKRVRLVRVAKGRVHAVAKAAPLLRDPEALWQRAFDALPELGRAITGRTDGAPFTLFFDELLPDLLNTLYGMDDMPVARLEETVWLACREYEHYFAGDRRASSTVLRRRLGDDLVRTFDVLADLGAVELSRGPADELYLADLDHEAQELPPESVERLRTRLAEPDLLLARLTPLGQRAVRARLLAEGRDAPLIGELAEADPAELLGVLTQHYPPYDAAAELHGWLAQPGHGIEPLLEAVRRCPFRTRAGAMLNVLAEALPDGRALLHGLRRDPVLGPAALTYLVDVGELDPSAIGQDEHLLLAAENFLTLLELGGPQTLIEQLKAMAGREAYELVAAVLDAGHHDTAGLEEIRALVAEPLRTTHHRPLRLIPGTGTGTRTARDKRHKR